QAHPAVVPVSNKVSPLMNVARKACTGRIFQSLPILSVISMRQPLKSFAESQPLRMLAIEAEQCPQPIDNAVFVIGHNIAPGEALFYKTSPQGEIIQAARMINLGAGN